MKSPLKKPQFGGEILLYDRNVQRPRESLANALTASFGVHQRHGQ
jgi:hypothetical protein